MEVPFYTKSQLVLCNGQGKAEVWIAYNGVIYECKPLTDSGERNSRRDSAGQNLTDELKDARYTEYVFEKFPVIGQMNSDLIRQDFHQLHQITF